MSPDYRVISKIGHMLQHTHIYIHIYIYIYTRCIYIYIIYMKLEVVNEVGPWGLGYSTKRGLQDLIAETVGNS